MLAGRLRPVRRDHRSRRGAVKALILCVLGGHLVAPPGPASATTTRDACAVANARESGRSAGTCAGAAAADKAASGDDGRNILLILADDLGLEAATLYPASLRRATEPPAPATPNLEELARHGVLFRNAWVNPSCSPTRATILTGRYGFRTGMGWHIPPRGSRRHSPQPSLSIDERTLPEAFAMAEKGRRYAMALIGKWHQSAGKDDPIRYGWPDFVGPDPTDESGAIKDFFKWPKVSGGVVRMTRTYATTDTVDEALHRVRSARKQGRPYLLWVAFNAVHQPFQRPPDHLHARDWLLEQGASRRDYYGAMVEALDRELGRLFREVDLAHTTVIFLSDNGTPRDVIASPYDSSHGKLSLYEDGIRVPLLIAGAGVTAPGRIVEGLAQGVDLFPTILELAGIDAEQVERQGAPPIDGVSLLPYLEGENAVPVRTTAYSEQFVRGNPEDRFERTVRNARYKYIERAPGLGVPQREFFDLRKDPHELNNLLAGALSPAEREEMEELARELQVLLASRCPEGCATAEAWERSGEARTR